MMSTPNWLAIAVVLFFTFLRPTTAFQCGNETTLLLSSEDDIERNLAGCTSWLGSLKIAYDWNGPFSLPNITNITGTFSTETYRGNSYYLTSSSLTAIWAIDLESVGDIIFEDAPLLSMIYLTKLKNVDAFKLLLDSDLVPNTEMAGSFPFVDFPKLETIEEGIYITNNRSFIGYHVFDPVTTSASMAIDMPKLSQAQNIHILGHISFLSMPSLAIMSISDDYSTGGRYDGKQLEIYTNGEPLAVTFPSLRNVTDIDLSGTLSMVSFPALESMYGSFVLEPTINMTFNSKPLRRAEEIQLSGDVTNYSIDSLTSLDRLSITTLAPIDCERATAVWTRIHPSYTTNNYSNEYSCTDFRGSVTEKSKKPFPTIPVGLAVGIGIPVWLFFMFALWHSRKEKKKAEEIAKIPPPDYDAEMAARSAGGGEVLPDYEPRRSQGSESHPGSVIELVDMMRPSPHPPGYEAATGGGNTIVPAVADAGDADAGRVTAVDGPRPGVGS
ncbi:hypothetical protein BKA61DRAFT_710441 [Leptodontidium sp. MPI-SDFR-AT-0119]|nr:hypothetical protein BKA61DRAFT_710441 [Leptodontidium sp. MPI-SDFR-AT-0119]